MPPHILNAINLRAFNKDPLTMGKHIGTAAWGLTLAGALSLSSPLHLAAFVAGQWAA